MEAVSSSETSVSFAVDNAYIRRVESWTKEPIAIRMRRYEGNIEIDPKMCSRIGLNSSVMTRYTIMNCLSAYKHQIPLLVQYQLSKVLVPLSQYECVRHWNRMSPRANRSVCASWSTIPWRRAAAHNEPTLQALCYWSNFNKFNTTLTSGILSLQITRRNFKLKE
jgi:hypothetical protein